MGPRVTTVQGHHCHPKAIAKMCLCSVYLCFCIFAFVYLYLYICILIFVFVYLHFYLCICIFAFVFAIQRAKIWLCGVTGILESCSEWRPNNCTSLHMYLYLSLHMYLSPLDFVFVYFLFYHLHLCDIFESDPHISVITV